MWKWAAKSRESKPTDVLGRIAAQTAKQVILQKVREAERDTIYNEFHTRVGELINSVVKRMEGPDIIVDMGRTEARLPKREQSRLEAYNVGDRLRVTIRAVERAAKGPQVVVSRADPALVQRLFEMEVPEIYDGTVQIRAVAREAGERTKIAVESRDKDVDPVGACVGMKGMRVQSIIRELRGEKIDIIPFNEETVAFAQKALSPAKVTRVQIIDPEEKRLEVIVEDTQLSLAIGKKGQNVRLASKLIGWNIDIKSEEEKRREIEAQMAALTAPGTALTQLAGRGPEDHRKAGSRGRHFDRKAGGHDAGTAGGNSRHRRENGGEDSPVRRRVFRSAGNGGYRCAPDAAVAAEGEGVATEEAAAAGEEAALVDEATEEATEEVAAGEGEAVPDADAAPADVAAEAEAVDEATEEATEEVREEEIGTSEEGAESNVTGFSRAVCWFARFCRCRKARARVPALLKRGEWQILIKSGLTSWRGNWRSRRKS